MNNTQWWSRHERQTKASSVKADPLHLFSYIDYCINFNWFCPVRAQDVLQIRCGTQGSWFQDPWAANGSTIVQPHTVHMWKACDIAKHMPQCASNVPMIWLGNIWHMLNKSDGTESLHVVCAFHIKCHAMCLFDMLLTLGHTMYKFRLISWDWKTAYAMKIFEIRIFERTTHLIQKRMKRTHKAHIIPKGQSRTICTACLYCVHILGIIVFFAWCCTSLSKSYACCKSYLEQHFCHRTTQVYKNNALK